jgi:hypothetical protein
MKYENKNAVFSPTQSEFSDAQSFAEWHRLSWNCACMRVFASIFIQLYCTMLGFPKIVEFRQKLKVYLRQWDMSKGNGRGKWYGGVFSLASYFMTFSLK